MGESNIKVLRDAMSQAGGGGRRVSLPGGILHEGKRYKDVTLRELTGADEEILCGSFVNGAQQVTALLARAIAGVEGCPAPVDIGMTENMLVGDRDYLLLRLRQIEVGDLVHEVVRCRNTACAHKVDVEFLISEIPVRKVDELAATLETSLVDEQSKTQRARLRFPTGADLDAIAEFLPGNPGAANTRLYARVLDKLEGQSATDEETVRRLPLRLRAQLATFIANNAPGPDLAVDIACPHCGTDMSYSFDLNAFFLPSVS
ncbi:MAG TPA: hypothetical protein VJM53_04870 [Burkholderiales bacterium]|nr:hypothetical protein [Burkholderiales bacterium]